ncbi:leucine-rich repeat domain-containing protein [Portibacter marinus]|uniref:leucine-rich repeat domain-containing protein n=1 Tax=Portibacter marinus TaxID=2898660 RepID=UPI001F4608E0|nr:T9SS type A sorting domain-containing protein [Portibacter marinus]
MRLYLLLRLTFLTTLGSVMLLQSDNPSFQFQCDAPSHPDYDALMALFNATDGSNWTNNGGWGSDCDVCNWYGVGCSGNEVWSLSLSNNNLVGILPDELGQMQYLERFHAWDNQITGGLPDGLFEAPSLDIIVLNDNPINGPIPPSITNAQKLKTFRCSHCELTGQLPEFVNTPTILEELSISYNNIEGSIPSSISNLSNLKHFLASYNNLSGELPETIGQNLQLERLSLSNNKLTGQLPVSIKNLTNLKRLTLRSNNLTATLPAGIGNLINLEHIDLVNAGFAGEIPQDFANLKSLVNIRFENTAFTGQIPDITGMLNLRMLYIYNGTSLTGSLPDNIGSLSKLRDVRLAGNRLSGSLPKSLGQLQDLWYLYLENNELTGTIPSEMSEMSSLRDLRLSNNQLHGNIPDQFANLTMLNVLLLKSNRLEGPFPAFLAENDNLSSLSLQSNRFSGCFPPSYQRWCGMNLFNFFSNCTFENPTFSQFCAGEPCNNSLNLSKSVFEACKGESVRLSAPNGYSSYQWSVPDGDNRTVTIEASTSQFYYITITNTLGCSKTDSIFLSVVQSVPGEEFAQLCPDQTITINGEIFNSAGNYVQLLPLPGRCDSTVLITITEGEASYGQYSEIICEGGTTTINGQSYPPGHYEQIIPNHLNCDSIISITIDQYPVFENSIYFEICEGELYEFEGDMLPAGHYTYPFLSVNGCDSTVRIEIKENQKTYHSINSAICEGDSVSINDEIFDAPGFYERLLINSNGCDSLLTIEIKENEKYYNTTQFEICEGSSITIENKELYEAGTHQFQYLSRNGCDSIVEIVISVKEPSSISITDFICEEESVTYAGQEFSEPGNYTIELQNENGCDSMIYLDLRITEGRDEMISATTCRGTSYFFGGKNRYTAGIYKDSIITDGCQSEITLHLKVEQPSTLEYDQFICEGESINFYGLDLSIQGIYSSVLTSSNGCDSTITVHLFVHPSSNTEIDTLICIGSVIDVDGITYNSPTTLMISKENAFGCDSSVVWNIDTYPMAVDTFDAVVCEGNEIEFLDGHWYGAGRYSGTYNDGNCLQGFELIVAELAEVKYDVIKQICLGQGVEYMGQTYDRPGIYEVNVETDFCESIENLIVLQGSNENHKTTMLFCEGNSFQIGEQQVSTSGEYEWIDASCNTNYFSILFTADDTIQIEEYIPDGAVFYLNEHEFDEAGEYEFFITTVDGCLVLVQLRLVFENCGGIRSYDVSLCDGEEYLFFGEWISQPGSYDYYKPQTSGCDSVIQLNVEVTATIEFEILGLKHLCPGEQIELSGPAGYEYLWSNGATSSTIEVSAAGTYELTIFNGSSCASSSQIFVESIQLPEGPIQVNKINPSNCVADDGYIEIISGDGASEYLYSIDGGVEWQDNPQFTNLENGSYQIVISDHKLQCSKKLDAFVVLESAGIPGVKEINIDQVNSCIGQLGVIEIILEDSMQNYLYSINGGDSWQENPVFKGLDTGVYAIEVKAANNDCVNAQNEVEIFNIGLLEANVLVVDNLSCFSAQDASAKVEIVQGLPPFSISWSNGQQGNIASQLGSGAHHVNIKDANQCLLDLAIEIEAAELDSLLIPFEDTTWCELTSIQYTLDSNFSYRLYWNQELYRTGHQLNIEDFGNYEIIVENGDECVSSKNFEVKPIDTTGLGINFLLASQGVINVENVLVNISSDETSDISFQIDTFSAVIYDINPNAKGIVFSDTGSYNVIMTAWINGCRLNFTREIEIYSDSSWLDFDQVDPSDYQSDFLLDWHITPNPNDGNFIVDINVSNDQAALNIFVFDVFGGLMSKRTLIGNNHYVEPFHLTSLSSGIYSVVLNYGEQNHSTQILVVK